MSIPQSLVDATQYLRTQLECIPEDYPDVELTLISAWVDYISLDAVHDVDDIISALDILKNQGFASDSVQEVIEELECMIG